MIRRKQLSPEDLADVARQGASGVGDAARTIRDADVSLEAPRVALEEPPRIDLGGEEFGNGARPRMPATGATWDRLRGGATAAAGAMNPGPMSARLFDAAASTTRTASRPMPLPEPPGAPLSPPAVTRAPSPPFAIADEDVDSAQEPQENFPPPVAPRLRTPGAIGASELPERPSMRSRDIGEIPMRDENPYRAPDISDKSFAGQFGANAEERAGLKGARAEDDAIQRRSRILRGVFGGLTLLGAATGAQGLAGLGMTGLGVSRAAQRNPDNEERMQADIDRRIAGDTALRGAQSEAASNAATAERQSREDARQATMDEANLANINARTANVGAETEADALEAALATSDAAGQRAAIRATIGGLNDDSGLVQSWRELVNSPEFEQMSGDSLRAFGGQIAQLANNRRAGVLEGGGGRGRGASAGLDAAGNPIIIPGSSGRSRGLAAPTLPEGPAPTAPTGLGPQGAPLRFSALGAPSGGETRRPAGPTRPVVTAQPSQVVDEGGAPVPAADPILAYINGHYPNVSVPDQIVMRAAAIRNGISAENISTPAANRVLTAAREQYHAEGANQQRMLGEAGQTAARELDPMRPGPQITDIPAFNRARQEMGRVVEEGVAPFQTAAYAVRQAVQQFGEANVRLAMQAQRIPSGVDAATARGLGNLLGKIQNVREHYGRSRSGAAISDSEWANFDRILGNTSIFSGPDQFISAMGDLANIGNGLVRLRATQFAGGNSADDVATEYTRIRRAVAEAERDRRAAARRPAGGAR